MTAREDLYAVLVLLTELDRTRHPHRAGGDSGGYGVEPGIPPPLPPSGLPGAGTGGPVSSLALTAQEWRARGRDPYAARTPASTERAPAPRALEPTPAPPARSVPSATDPAGGPLPVTVPDTAPVRNLADGRVAPPPAQARPPVDRRRVVTAAPEPSAAAPASTATWAYPGISTPPVGGPAILPTTTAGGDRAPILPSADRPAPPRLRDEPDERADASAGRGRPAPPAATDPPARWRLDAAPRSPRPRRARGPRGGGPPPPAGPGSQPRRPGARPPAPVRRRRPTLVRLDAARLALDLAAPAAALTPAPAPISAPPAPADHDDRVLVATGPLVRPVGHPGVVHAGRRRVALTPVEAARLRRAVTAGFLDRTLRRGP